MKYKVEAFDLWNYLCFRRYGYQPLIKLRISFSGHINIEALKRAVTLSLKTIPLLGCCVTEGFFGPRWVDKGFTGDDMVSLVEDYSGGADADADADAGGRGADADAGGGAGGRGEVESGGGEGSRSEGEWDGDEGWCGEDEELKYLSGEIDFFTEPQMKITIVRKHSGDAFYMIMSHLICDGGGFKQYMYLLCSLYTCIINGADLPTQSFERRAAGLMFAGLGLKEKMRVMRSESSTYDPTERTEQRGVDTGEGAPEVFIVRRILPKEVFDAFKAFVKANNATVNDGLMALFARAFCKSTGTDRILLPSTMDFRKFIPARIKHGISHYSSFCMCRVPVGPADSLAETVARVSEQMREYKSGNNVLKSALMWDLAARFIPYKLLLKNFSTLNKLPKFYFSNVGVFEFDLFSFDKLPINDIYITTSFRMLPSLQINVSTYNDCCTLSCYILGPEEGRRNVARLLDAMYAEASRAPHLRAK